MGTGQPASARSGCAWAEVNEKPGDWLWLRWQSVRGFRFISLAVVVAVAVVVAMAVVAVTKRGQLWYWLWLCWQSLKGVQSILFFPVRFSDTGH